MRPKERSTTIHFIGEVHIPPQLVPGDEEWQDPIKDAVNANLQTACALIVSTLAAQFHLRVIANAEVE